MKKIVPEYSFSEEQLNSISSLSRATGLTENVTRILFARGFDSKEKIQSFMNPSAKNFLSPFLMRGMRETVEMLKEAKEEGKTVVVFGDYDADGVCACAIMYHALKEFGIEPRIYVPERADGYGLSEAAIDRIFEDCVPELFITVDCGISCADEIEYLYELGADVIVTDHQLRGLTGILLVLRIATDARIRINHIAFTNHGVAMNVHMALQHGACTDLHIRTDHTERTHHHVVGQLCIRVDNRKFMDLCHYASPFPI